MTTVLRTVRAAGGIVVREGPDGEVQVALVHRPKYEDWTFPKGKRMPGESDRDTALREVTEETGLRCAIEALAGRVRYRDRKHRPKLVVYWLMRPVSGDFRPSDEVDRMRWVPVEEAAEVLTYAHDRSLLRTVLAKGG